MKSRPTGAAIVPSQPGSSRLYRMVLQGKMPPTGRLQPGEMETLRRWIAASALYPPEPLTVADPRAH